MVNTNSDGGPTEMAVPGGNGLDARIYRILGEQFLTSPDRGRVDAIERWASEWLRSAEESPLAIEMALERIQEGSQADLESLQRAYTYLFRGISQRGPKPPYESLYVDGQFYGATTTEIRRAYRWVGLDAPENELSDHLGLELQFLGELTAMVESHQGTDEIDPAEARWWLLDKHLTKWLPAYHARIQLETPPAYYAGLLDLTLAVVMLHHDLLKG